MASILSQSEIDALLDAVDEPEILITTHSIPLTLEEIKQHLSVFEVVPDDEFYVVHLYSDNAYNASVIKHRVKNIVWGRPYIHIEIEEYNISEKQWNSAYTFSAKKEEYAEYSIKLLYDNSFVLEEEAFVFAFSNSETFRERTKEHYDTMVIDTERYTKLITEKPHLGL